MANRKSGILLHPSSLPSAFGVGDFGQAAYTFLDRLAEAKQTLWQILPLVPTDAWRLTLFQRLRLCRQSPASSARELLLEEWSLERSGLAERFRFPLPQGLITKKRQRSSCPARKSLSSLSAKGSPLRIMLPFRLKMPTGSMITPSILR